MEYLIPIWWPSVYKIVQKHRGIRFSHCSCHCETVSNSVCLSEGATVTKGAGLTDRSIGNTLVYRERLSILTSCLLACLLIKYWGKNEKGADKCN